MTKHKPKRLKTILTSLAASATLTACTPEPRVRATAAATETERELCLAWETSLPGRSLNDTSETRYEIGEAYDAWEAICRKTLGLDITPWWNK